MTEDKDPKVASKPKRGPVREIARGLVTLPWTAAVDMAVMSKDAFLGFPKAVLQGAKEERIALKTFADREKAISGQVMLWWGLLVAVACLTFFLIGGWGNLLTVAIGFVWVCSRFGWWDPVRDIVTKRALDNENAGDPQAKSFNAYDAQILQQEISAHKCEVALGILKEWNKLPKTERGPKSPETIVRLIDTLTRAIGSSVVIDPVSTNLAAEPGLPSPGENHHEA